MTLKRLVVEAGALLAMLGLWLWAFHAAEEALRP